MAPKKKAIVEPDVNVPGIFNNISLINVLILICVTPLLPNYNLVVSNCPK